MEINYKARRNITAKMMIKFSSLGDKKRDQDKAISSDVTVISDIYYGPHSYYNKMEFYYKKETDMKYPVIINIHGGGYVYGDTDVYKYYCAALAEYGFFVISFNYTLAPYNKFPGILEETNEVVKYMVEHKDEYNLDIDNVFIVGDSAGAQLASQYGVIYSNKKYQDLIGIVPPCFKLKAMGLNCGMYNILPNKDEKLKGLMEMYFTKKPIEKYGELLNVLAYIDSNYPPCYLMTFEGDFLKENCIPMYELLVSKNVEAVYKIYGDETTKHVFHIDCDKLVAIQANTDEMNFFKKYLGEEYERRHRY